MIEKREYECVCAICGRKWKERVIYESSAFGRETIRFEGESGYCIVKEDVGRLEYCDEIYEKIADVCKECGKAIEQGKFRRW